MTLQSSGSISMSQINTELGRSATAQISLDTAENGGYATINTASTNRPSSGNPASMSEWYGYNHNAASGTCYYVYNYNGGTSGTIYWTDINGTGRSGTLSGYSGAYICSTSTPYESPAADVNVSNCNSACSKVHTSIAGAQSDQCAC